jgi:hypothetical protein
MAVSVAVAQDPPAISSPPRTRAPSASTASFALIITIGRAMLVEEQFVEGPVAIWV